MSFKSILIKALPVVTILWVLLMIVSLKYGLLDRFFYDSSNVQVQGIDYFAVPKSFLNLLEGISAYDTWSSIPYGPYATWYLAHPAFSVFVASWFSFFPPWTSYWIFALFSIALMVYSAWLIAKNTSSKLNKHLSYFLMLCAFPTYWVLYVGNMHATLIIGLVFIFISLYQFANTETDEGSKKANQNLYIGLLISFFTKPIVILMLPVLLLTRQTRKTTLITLGIYSVISIAFICIPLLNPQAVGISKLSHIVFDFDYIKNNMNIYKNNFVLNEYMKDNSIHWLNLIAQSDHRLMHVDVFSLPVFLDTILSTQLNARLYKLPIYIVFVLSLFVPFIPNKKIKFQAILLLVMAIILTFFLSYNSVWEYQYSSALPIVAFLPLLWDSNVFYKKVIPTAFITGLFFCMPSFYFMLRGQPLSPSVLTSIRLDRVLPALILFVLFIAPLTSICVKQVIKPFFRSITTSAILPRK